MKLDKPGMSRSKHSVAQQMKEEKMMRLNREKLRVNVNHMENGCGIELIFQKFQIFKKD